MNAKIQLTAVCLSVIVLLFLSGCTVKGLEGQKVSDEVVLSIPDSNPYKAEITEAFNASKSSFARKVLADGVVTEAELFEAQSQYVTCLEKIGLKVTITKNTFGDTFNMEPVEGRELNAQEVEKSTAECDSLGYLEISAIHGQTTGNPDRKNPVEMMLKCLKKRGVVEKGVMLKEFDPLYEDWNYMDAHRKDFDECYADPNFYNQ